MRAVAFPPLRPARFFCCVVPPCLDVSREEPLCERFPPRFEAPGGFAIFAARLFDIYYRSPQVTRRAAGAGIGLFVSKALVDAMRGRIWATEREGGGAEFGFALPAVVEPVDDDSGAGAHG